MVTRRYQRLTTRRGRGVTMTLAARPPSLFETSGRKQIGAERHRTGHHRRLSITRRPNECIGCRAGSYRCEYLKEPWYEFECAIRQRRYRLSTKPVRHQRDAP